MTMAHSMASHGSFYQNDHDPRTKVEKLTATLEFLRAEMREKDREIAALKALVESNGCTGNCNQGRNCNCAVPLAAVDQIVRQQEEIAALTAERDMLVGVLESFGHKPGCRKNSFGDKCTCGVSEVLARIKGE